MSGIYIPGMEMPETGVYEIAVDNTWGKDKTIMTLYTRKDNGMLHVFGSYELVPVPEHGRLIDADAMEEFIRKEWDKNDHWIAEVVYSRPTIIPADKEGEGC